MFEQNINWDLAARNNDNLANAAVSLADLAGITKKAKNEAARQAIYKRALGGGLSSLAGPQGDFSGNPVVPQGGGLASLTRPMGAAGYGKPGEMGTAPTNMAGNGQPESRAPSPQQAAYSASIPAQQPAPAASQGAPFGGFTDADLMQIMSDPTASEDERAFARGLAGQRAAPKDPVAEQLAKVKLAQAQKELAGGSARRSLQPVWGVGPDGKPAIVQLGDDGSALQTKLPDGFNVANKPIEMDLGTKIVLLDPQTRQPIGERAKDIAGVEAQKQVGEVQGKQIAGAKGDVTAADNALAVLDNILADPVLQDGSGGWGTGASSMLNAVPGTAGYNFQTKINQVQGVAFLQAIQQLRGMGSLSNAEGATATAALTRINSGLDPESLKTATGELRTIIERGRARALQLSGGQAPSAGGGDDLLSQARDAISRGADPAAVRQRLMQNGVDPAGL